MPYKKYVDIIFTKLLAVYSYKDYYIAVMAHTDSYALRYDYEMVVFTADGSGHCVGHPKDDSELEFDLTPHIINDQFIRTIKRNQKSESFIPTMSIKQLTEELDKLLEGDKALGYWNSNIKVGDKVETEEGERGEVTKRYHDFAGQLRYRVRFKDGERSVFWGKLRLLDSVKKEKTLKKSVKPYSIDALKSIILKICSDYGLDYDTKNLNIRDTIDNSILITGIPRRMISGALYSASTAEREKEYFNKIISSIEEYLNQFDLKFDFVNDGEDICRGQLEVYFY